MLCLGALETFFYNENLWSKNVFRGISCPNLLVLLIPYPLGISDSGLALFNIMQYFENMLQASRNMLIVLFANYAMSQNILRKNHTKLNNNFPFHRTSVRDSIEIAQILVACLNDSYIL